ncbi:MAG: hypothetical protein HOF74_07485 [Gammaproteobacteria bacterium]|jgi:DUF4097 and DUF4098 domain-containing protein YvlB|nr:hypothetical protein [Gammaproteobacteria bacterium]MBT3859654.1 hypothetical protein [Gammaproteobacteria bacterium]MBT3987627.1 hypothetical protein [Gammaproteobacteria bacterium]MBT4254762.1 hypothetical protein [Gammaproteobacteria bacterium]MBT4581633.1 hypothetical protein [Gammaproteobacteria bacterium]
MFRNKLSQSILSMLLVLAFQSSTVLAADADIEREFDVAANGTLTIESDAGEIDVETWSQNQVHIVVHDPDGFEVEFDQSGNDVTVVADSRGSFFGLRRSNISFTVQVPVRYNVDLNTGGGKITVSDISGEVEVDTSGGSIDIGVVSGGDVNADTSGGSITIEQVDGDVFADTSGGNITVGNVTGSVEVDTSGGRILIANVSGDISADTSGGNIEVGEGGGSVDLDTSGGSIRAGWAEGPLSAETSGGNITLAGGSSRVSADTSGGNITIEGGSGSVLADTSGGNITIRNVTGEVSADTSGGRIELDLSSVTDSSGGDVSLDTAGGDITVRLPANLGATIDAVLNTSRRGRGSYRIFTDFPLSIREEDDQIIGSGDINGGGYDIELETTNSDIHIISVAN